MPRIFHVIVHRIGHRASKLLIALVVIQLLTAMLPENYRSLSFFNGLAGLLLILCLGGRNATNDPLCPTCIAMFPVDAPKKAARARWQFAATHMRGRLGAPTTLIVAGDVLLFIDPQGLSSILCFYAGFIGIMVFGICMVTHQKYQPWCPKCRNGGTGTAAHEPALDPRPSMTPKPL